MKIVRTASLAFAVLLSLATTSWAVEQNAMFTCMDEQQSLPPVSRASACECYVGKSVAWSARLTQAIASQAIAHASKRSMLNECISADYSHKNDPSRPR